MGDKVVKIVRDEETQTRGMEIKKDTMGEVMTVHGDLYTITWSNKTAETVNASDLWKIPDVMFRSGSHVELDLVAAGDAITAENILDRGRVGAEMVSHSPHASDSSLVGPPHHQPGRWMGNGM